MKRFVLEWSASQRAFHIQELESALEANRRRFSQRLSCLYDWVPMYIGTYEECEAVAEHNAWKMERIQPGGSLTWTH